MRVFEKLPLITLATLAPAAAMAHPGPHPGDVGAALAHLGTSADHLLVIGLAISAATGLAALAIRQSRR